MPDAGSGESTDRVFAGESAVGVAGKEISGVIVSIGLIGFFGSSGITYKKQAKTIP